MELVTVNRNEDHMESAELNSLLFSTIWSDETMLVTHKKGK